MNKQTLWTFNAWVLTESSAYMLSLMFGHTVGLMTAGLMIGSFCTMFDNEEKKNHE